MILTLIFTIIPLLLAAIWLTCFICERLYDSYHDKMWDIRNAVGSEAASTNPLYIKYKARKEKLSWISLHDYYGWGIAAIFGLVIAFFNTIILISFINPHTVNKKYNNFVEEKAALEYRLEHPELPGNELLYKDIVQFNEEIRNYKADRENPWLSWYFSDKIASIEFVDYRG